MPECDPERSPDACIAALKLCLDELGLPYSTRAEWRHIHQVLYQVREEYGLDLGYLFELTRSGERYSLELQLDLGYLLTINPTQPAIEFSPNPQPWDGRKLSSKATAALREFRSRTYVQ